MPRKYSDSLSKTNNANTPTELSRVAKGLYTEGPLMMRMMQHYRPFISPFGCLIELVPASSCVLDIGCGGGLFLALLNHFNRLQRGIGIDSSRDAVNIAEGMRRLCPNPGRLEFLHAEAEKPLPEGPFDVVLLLDVIHHIKPNEQISVLKKAIDCLAPGGVLLYKDMARKPVWRAFANRIHDLLIAHQFIHYLPLQSVVDWANQNKCNVVATDRIDILWYAHEWVILKKN